MSDINRLQPAPPDLGPVMTDYFYRTVNGYREHVRRSDGLVVSRERIKSAEGVMQERTQERANALIGRHEGRFTIVGLAGQHPSTGAIQVNARCDCGTEVGPVLAYNVTSHRLRSHNGCTLPKPERKTRARAVTVPVKRKRQKPPYVKQAPAPVENGNGKPSLERSVFRTQLVEEASLLRRTAVAVVKGADPAVVARAMRDQADLIDELVYEV